MIAKPKDNQGNLFDTPLKDFLNIEHPLYKLALEIDWEFFNNELGSLFNDRWGAPAKPTRLMVGLHYLKYAFDLSDEGVVAFWIENPYWQFFCGYDYFQHQLPIHPSSMTRWRKRLGSKKMEKLLQGTIRTAFKNKLINNRSFGKLNVDSTVQEKAIAFPTDARLLFKARQHLAEMAKKYGIVLRQNYNRKAKLALVMASRYDHARQMKRKAKQIKLLRNFLGRVIRDVERKIADHNDLTEIFNTPLHISQQILNQRQHSKNKIYSFHALEVECIAKGKKHKKFEFGCKVGLVTTSKECFIVGAQAFHGNPYDGHTLDQAITQAEMLGNFKAVDVFVDRGYRGHNYKGKGQVHIAHNKRKTDTRALRGWMKRRNSIEAVISHTKLDGRLDRNYLQGSQGDRINAILSACGFNMRKLIRQLSFLCLLIFRPVNEQKSSMMS
jgi:IS5 family transposase